jgi:predicted nucleotidyltransferase
MKRNILQIPIKTELRAKVEKRADQLGFSSIQEMIRVILTQLTRERDFKVDDICDKYDISYLGLFGSMARGEAREDSDVDLLVKFGDASKVGLFELDRIQRELEMRLGRKVDLVTKMNKYIEPEAMSDLKTIYEK